jgi:GntR family transcriptional regulator, transcriptional repressor for pyruvate dehydrogenase complex
VRARAPRMAEVVATRLREEILRGDVTVLPRLEDLIDRFGAGPPAVREAMRILETEGLITIRRGNVGGADVHLPTPANVAYMVALVLQSKTSSLSDVGIALRVIEPLCAAMCAARHDRRRTVVPELRRILADQVTMLGDVSRSLELVDEFHQALVLGCGSETLKLVVGALEELWSAHATAVYGAAGAPETAPATWKAALRDHERIIAAIERGDEHGASDLARRHLEATHAYMSKVDDARQVSASVAAGRG